MCFHGLGTLTSVNGHLNAKKYLEIVDSNLYPVITRHFPNKYYVYQNDSALVHLAHIMTDFAETKHNGVAGTVTGSQQNRNVWLNLEKGLRTNVRTMKTSNELFNEIITIWGNMTLDYTRKLYYTLPKHVSEVMREKGHLTKYYGKTVSLRLVYVFCFNVMLDVLVAILKWTNTIGTMLYGVLLRPAYCTMV